MRLGPFIALEATEGVLNTHNLWNARVAWGVDNETLVETRTGGYERFLSSDPRPPNSRAGPPALRDGNFISVNAIFFRDSNRGRADAAVSLTRYADIAGQAHDLKAGLEFEVTSSTDGLGNPGGMFFFQQRRFLAAQIWAGETDEATSRRGTAYMRDRWSLSDRVTLGLGIRLDVNRAGVPVQGTILSTSPVSPRAGVAWAVTADHTTVLRAHYGRYYDSILTRVAADLDVSDQNPRIVAVEVQSRQSCEAFGATVVGDSANGVLCEVSRTPPMAAQHNHRRRHRALLR